MVLKRTRPMSPGAVRVGMQRCTFEAKIMVSIKLCSPMPIMKKMAKTLFQWTKARIDLRFELQRWRTGWERGDNVHAWSGKHWRLCNHNIRSPVHRNKMIKTHIHIQNCFGLRTIFGKHTLWLYKLILKHLLNYRTKLHYIDFVWPLTPSSLMDIWYIVSSKQKMLGNDI